MDFLDPIARRAAQTFSRRHVLRTSGAGLGLVVLPRTLSVPDVGGRVTQSPLDPRNTFSGESCTAFGGYMSTTGVYDTAGSNHPGWAGVTEFFPAVGAFRVTPAQSSQIIWECPCAPGVYWETQKQCDSHDPCKPGLGGCLVKCGGVNGICLSDSIKIPYSGSTRISVLRWRPPSSTPACATAIAAFDAAVRSHEQHHASDAKAILDERASRPAKKFKACGRTYKEASDKLAEMIHTFVVKEVDRMEKDFEQSIIDFHGTPAGQPVNMDCTAC